ncbi:hypothetical protein SmJEL517_g02692 [Synchytrium microbalum]|uniref:Uncharacterized protein n=1 Tax=Synchytrium microbalum TaxID=1806994 RepID=A0A507C5T3_9FUNG|nr:uncharacterized protein SmJEL517_g02692 [Synchytrium microbalum]TPX34718.1 hypothetical protein SmJEL517_g02692 [Synchytrium microbalum]
MSSWMNMQRPAPPRHVAAPPSYMANAPAPLEHDLGETSLPGTTAPNTMIGTGFGEPAYASVPATETEPQQMSDVQRWTVSPQGTLVSPDNNYQYNWDKPADEKAEPSAPWYRRRKWITCFIITAVLILLLIILLPIVFLVIIPKAIQGTLDSAVLTFTSASITQPTATTFRLDSVLGITNAGTTDATLTYNGPIVVSYNGYQIFNLTVNPVNIRGGGANITIGQTVTIYNTTQLAAFNRDLLNMNVVNLQFTDSLSIAAAGQSFNNLALDKTVPVNGLGGLQNVTLNNFNIGAPTTVNGSIPITSSLTLSNPSNFNVQVGDILFALALSDNTTIGTVTTKNVSLQQGNNSLSAVGQINAGANNVTPLANLQSLFQAFVNGQGLTGVATDVTSGAPQWLKSAIVGLKLNLMAPGGSDSLIQSVEFGGGGLGLSFNAAAPYAPQLTVGGIVAGLSPDFKFNVNFTAIEQNLTLAYQGVNMAVINSTRTPASGSGTGGQLTTSIASALQVISGQEKTFQNFLSAVFNGAASDMVPVNIKGLANVYASTPAGIVSVPGVPITTTWSMGGFGSLNDVTVTTPPTITSADAATGVLLNVPILLNNPSTVSFSAGAISLNLVSGGQVIGSLTIPGSTVIKPGANNIVTVANYHPLTDAAKAAGVNFLGSFISNTASSVTAQGFANSTNVASLVPVFSGVSFSSSLPAQTGELLANSQVNVVSIFPPALSITLYANNYYPIPVTITHLVSVITQGSTTLATIDSAMTWTIPANARNAASPAFPLNATADGVFAFITSGGTVSAVASNKVTMTLNTYPAGTIPFTQSVSSSFTLR